MPFVVVTPDAQEEFARLDNSLKLIFAKHLKKFERLPPRRFLKTGLPYAIENVGQGRAVCKCEERTVTVLHIFPTHKEYEQWYRGMLSKR